MCRASHAAGAAISQLPAAPCCSQVVAIQMQVQEIRIQIDRPADAPPPPSFAARRLPARLCCACSCRLNVAGGQPRCAAFCCEHALISLACCHAAHSMSARTHARMQGIKPLGRASFTAVKQPPCTWPPPPQPRNCFECFTSRMQPLPCPHHDAFLRRAEPQPPNPKSQTS